MRCEIERAVLAGYDWGGRAACIVAALWPERVRGLVTCGGYNMHDVAGSAKPAAAEQEHRYWYQYYFYTERGRAGLTRKPARHREAAVAAVVAELDVRRRDIRGERALVRQSGFRRGGDPLVPRALRLRGRAIRRSRRSSRSLPRSRRSPCRRSCCRARPPAPCRPRHPMAHAKHFTGPYQRRTIPRVGHDDAAGGAARDRRGGAGTGAAGRNSAKLLRRGTSQIGATHLALIRRQPTERR